MSTLYSNNFLANRPIELAMKNFAKRFTKGQRVLDIGCGRKPYARYFSCDYIGLDTHTTSHTDVTANAWDVPFPDNHFEGIILNQSLEHVENIHGTIAEIKRVLKPGGYGIITVPQTMKNHSDVQKSAHAPVSNFDTTKEPYWRNDYWRFTKYGLMALFRDFRIIDIRETTGYIGTLMQLVNYFLASLHIGALFTPVYVVNNVIGSLFDSILSKTRKSNFPLLKRFYYVIYTSLTINYILIIQHHDHKSC